MTGASKRLFYSKLGEAIFIFFNLTVFECFPKPPGQILLCDFSLSSDKKLVQRNTLI